MKLIMEPRKHRQSYLEGKRKKNNTRVFAAEAANGPDEHQILLSISVRARSHQNLARELYACCLCGYFFSHLFYLLVFLFQISVSCVMGGRYQRRS